MRTSARLLLLLSTCLLLLSTCTGTPVTPTLYTKQPLPPPPTPPPLFSWLGQADLLFQPGDLPEEITPTALDNAIPAFLQDKLGAAPQGAAGLRLLQPGQALDYGNVSLFYYLDRIALQDISEKLVQTEELRTPGVPQAGIGEQAFLFYPTQAGQESALFFRECHSIVEIRLLQGPDVAVILRYGERLAQRIQQVDCRGAASVPVQSPPPLLPTATAQPAAAISQGFPANVSRLPDPQGMDILRAYAFLDAQHGWLALGASLLATADGGMTWQPQATAPAQVDALAFQSMQQGWMHTTQGYFTTRDGGATWQASANSPVEVAARLPRPATAKADNGDEIYTFCPDTSANGAGPFFALDAGTAWAFCTSGAMSHYVRRGLYQTSDGGQTWKLLTGQAPFGWSGASNLFFLDRQHGWLAAAEAGLYATVDGGLTWHSLDVFPPGDGTAAQVSFLSPQTGFVVARQMVLDDSRDVLLKTTDGGLSWQPIYQTPALMPLPTGPFQFFPDLSGIAAGDSAFLSTSDAGKTWSVLSPYTGFCTGDFALQATALSFVDRFQGWFVYTCAGQPHPVLYHTSDGGKTWSSLAAAGLPQDQAVALSFLDAHLGYLVTHGGYLFRTQDGGQTFAPVDGAAIHTRSLRFFTSQIAWETRGTQLYATSDGGKTWQALPVALPVQYFWRLPSGLAWLVTGETTADNGAPLRSVFTTNDDGQTLLEHTFGDLPSTFSAPYLDVLQFVDEQHGWLRAGASLYYTADGGRDWSQLH